MATKTTTPTIPDLTVEPGYAKALKRHHELGGMLADVRAMQRLVQAEFSKLNAATAGGPSQSDLDRKVAAFLADELTDPDEIDPLRTLADELAANEEKIEFMAAAVKKHEQDTLAPAKAAAQRKLAPVVFEQVWKPAMRKAIEQMVAFHRHWADVLGLAEQIADAGLWVSPLTHPIDQGRGSAKDHIESAANILRSAVEQGYFTAGEAKALIPSLKL